MIELERDESYSLLLFCNATLVLFIIFLVTDSIMDRRKGIGAGLSRIESWLDRRQ